MHITIPELSGPILINLSPGHRAFQAMNHFAWFCLHFSMSAVFLPHHMMTRAACSICWLPNVTLTVTQVGKAVETDLLCLRMCSDFLGFSASSIKIQNLTFQNTPQTMWTFEAKLLYHGFMWHNSSVIVVTTHLQHRWVTPISAGWFHLESLTLTPGIPRDTLDLPSTCALPSLMSTELPSFVPVPTSFMSALPFESILALFWCIADSAAKLHPSFGGEYVKYFFMTIVIKDLSWVKPLVRTLFILHESFNGTCSNCVHSSYSWWET